MLVYCVEGTRVLFRLSPRYGIIQIAGTT